MAKIGLVIGLVICIFLFGLEAYAILCAVRLGAWLSIPLYVLCMFLMGFWAGIFASSIDHRGGRS